MSIKRRKGFWHEAFAIEGAISPRVTPRVLFFGIIAGGISGAVRFIENRYQVRISLSLTPVELAGAALGLLLVFRTNAGYDRWWEARKLWGGFVDRSRNFAIDVVAYGPDNANWRDEILRWAAIYPHVARHTLRGEQPSTHVVNLIGEENAARLSAADHMPSFVALKLAELLRQACERFDMNRFAFLQVDRERALLIDNFGGCERILNTPMPYVYSIKIRSFILLFLVTLPFALLHRFESEWLVPFITMLIGFPLLSLDQIGVELENPFATNALSHLPLDEISSAIERNVLGLWQPKRTDST